MVKTVHPDADAATISLGSIVIDAPPDKVGSKCATHAQETLLDQLKSRTIGQVYDKLARAREWEGWLNVCRLIHTAQSSALETDNTFCYIGKLAPGFIDAIVQDAEPAKVPPVPFSKLKMKS